MRTVFAARGSSVLFNILRSLSGDSPFLLPANVCPIVPATFLKAGRPFVFVDIAEPDLMIERERCLKLLEKKFGGLLFVRTYGADGNEDEFFCRLKQIQPDLMIIDDKCLCRPDSDAVNVSSVADVTLFSTGHAKYVDIGFGGFAYLQNGVMYRPQDAAYSTLALESLNNRYKTRRDECALFEKENGEWLDLSPPEMSWDNYKDQVRSALQRADEHKQLLNAIYHEVIPSDVQLSQKFQGWRFNIRLPESKRLVARLFQTQLFASRHYQPVTGLFTDEDFPVARRLHEEVVNLFNDQNYNLTMAQRTTEIVVQHLAAL